MQPFGSTYYTFDFGDGTTPVTETTGQPPAHTYRGTGTFTLTTTATYFVTGESGGGGAT